MRSVLKKALVCIVAAMLMCIAPLTAFATDGEQSSNGLSITVENGNNAISIKGYIASAYKVMNVTEDELVNGETTEITYGNTFTGSFENFEYQDLSGAALIDKLTNKKTAVASTADLAVALSDYVKSAKVSATKTAELASSEGVERAVLSGLEEGYYLVTVAPQEGSNQSDACLPILVYLTEENQVVYAKFETPTITKVLVEGSGDKAEDVTEGTVELGSKVPFKVDTVIPAMSEAFAEQGYTFKITDTWTKGFDPDMDSLSITIDGAPIDFKLVDTSAESDEAVEGSEGDETLQSDTSSFCVVEKSDNSFTISFDPVAFYSNYCDKTGAPVSITYNAMVTEDIAEDQVAENAIKITYSNEPGQTEDFEGEEVKAYSFTIDVWKYTLLPDEKEVGSGGEGAVSLKDAQFVLYKKVTNEDTESYKYYKLENDAVVWVDDKSQATVAVTDENGVLTQPFVGLAAGTYYLEEVKAPDGYNQLDKPVEIVLSEPTGDNANLDIKKWVENSKGIVLPGTGGVGTIIFYCVGGALVIGALVVLIARRRMSSNQK